MQQQIIHKKKFEPEEFTEKIRKWGLLLLVLLVVGYGVYRLLAAILGG